MSVLLNIPIEQPARSTGVETELTAMKLRHAPRRFRSWFWTTILAAATLFIVAVIVWMLGVIVMNGSRGFSPDFIFGSTTAGEGMFDVHQAGVFPMVFGTVALVVTMTIFVLPAGVITAVYLHEYAPRDAWHTRVIRLSVNNLAGIPSIIFGLFGLGFFIFFVGRGLDGAMGNHEPVFGKPGLLWASLTMAVLTIPVVVVGTEEALRSIPQTIRDASTGLGATKLETLIGVVLPQALPGILTGSILAVSRGAGEVAPIMFVGAAYLAPLPRSFTDQFMELGYHIFVLATQSPDLDRTKPLLFATVVVLLMLTFCLNLLAIIARTLLRNSQQRQSAA